MKQEISVHDIEAVFQIECNGHGCDNFIAEESAEVAAQTARDSGWVRRDFDADYHGVLCAECDQEFAE